MLIKTNEIIKTLTEFEKLKTVNRGTQVNGRKESTAEHSWSCIMIADILIDYIKEPLDRLKVIEYLIYHDIVEIYAGDAKFNNPEELRLKESKEKLALEKINGFLPKENRINKIIIDYEKRETREAEFAKAIDCLDACLRNLNDNSKTDEDGFTESLIRKKYSPHVSKFEITNELFETFMKELIIQKKL